MCENEDGSWVVDVSSKPTSVRTTLELGIGELLLAKLRAQASTRGVGLEQYVLGLVEAASRTEAEALDRETRFR